LFLLPTGEKWKRHRKLIQPGFGPTHLRNSAQITQETMELMDAKFEKEFDARGTSTLEIDMHALTCAISLDIM
jgi:cytochrome P450